MSERDEFEAPYIIKRTHANQAYVTLGFSSEEACTQFIKATRHGRNDPTVLAESAAPRAMGASAEELRGALLSVRAFLTSERIGSWSYMEGSDFYNDLAEEVKKIDAALLSQPEPSREVERDAERIARNTVEQFRAALYRVPGFGNRVNKEVREKLTEAHCIILNLPALLDKVAMSTPPAAGDSQ